MTAPAWMQRLRRALAEDPALLAVCGITLAALALRWPLYTGALFGDEVTTYGVVSGHGPETLYHLVRSDIENTPPLYYFLAAAGERVIGAAEGVRLPSLLAGVAAVPLTYLLGAMTVGKRAGLVAAALMTVSPFVIFYSTEARSYALVMFLAVLSTVLLLWALERGRWWWGAYALACCAALWTTYTFGFILLAQLAWALIAHTDRWRPLLGAVVAAGIGILPWLPGFLEDRRSPTNIYDAVRPFSLDVAGEDLATWAIGHPHIPTDTLRSDWEIWLIVAGLVLGAVGLVLRVAREPRGERRLRPSPELLLLIALALVVPVGAAVYSELGDTVFTPRYLIPSWPALAVVVAALLTAGRGPLRYLPAALCIVGLGVGGLKMVDDDYERPAFDEVAGFIEDTGPPGAPVAAISSVKWGPQGPLEAALGDPHEARPGGHPVFIVNLTGGLGAPDVARRHTFLHEEISVLSWSVATTRLDAAQQAEAVARLADGGRIFFVSEAGVRLGPPLAADPPPPRFLDALPAGYRVVETRRFPGWRPVAVYVLERGTRAAES